MITDCVIELGSRKIQNNGAIPYAETITRSDFSPWENKKSWPTKDPDEIIDEMLKGVLE